MVPRQDFLRSGIGFYDLRDYSPTDFTQAFDGPLADFGKFE
jgi:hypothetical protein